MLLLLRLRVELRVRRGGVRAAAVAVGSGWHRRLALTLDPLLLLVVRNFDLVGAVGNGSLTLHPWMNERGIHREASTRIDDKHLADHVDR